MIDLDEYLADHQRTALKKLTNGKILWGGVGSGKTRVATAYYLQNEAPRRVYVITTAKKRDSFDWQEEFYSVGIGPATGPSADLRGNQIPVQQRADLDQLREMVDESDQERTNLIPTSSIGSVQRTPSQILQRADKPGRIPQDDGLDGDRGSAGSVLVAEGSHAGDPRRSSAPSLDDHEQPSANGLSYDAGAYPWVLTVDSWNNIAKYADVAGAFFIFDEQRLVGSGDWTRKFLRIAKRNRWILLSGTPGDTWMDYVPVFVANGFYKNRTEFKREHVVYNTFTKFPKVDRYINVGRLARQRSQLLVEMPFVRHTRRRHVEVMLPYDKELLNTVLKERWHVYEERPLNDIAEMFMVARRVVNSDPSRLAMVEELWKNHPKLIVFYNFNYELESLRSLGLSIPRPSLNASSIAQQSRSKPTAWLRLSNGENNEDVLVAEDRGQQSISPITGRLSAFPARDVTTGTTVGLLRPSGKPLSATGRVSLAELSTIQRSELNKHSRNGGLDLAGKSGAVTDLGTTSISEWNGHKHQAVPTTDRWLYLVQYIAGAEAWDCTETNAMIMYSHTYSWKVYEQAQGRIDRFNTPFTDLWYYGFTSDSFVDRLIRRSLKAKETFNTATFKGLFEG